MQVHFVVHEAFEAPGAYEDWAKSRSHGVSWSHLQAGDPLPASVDDIDLLIVMGGPQSPDTTTQECPHFDAAAECALISQAMAAGKAVIGVCLGSQLIGTALGASHADSPEKEIGKFPITLTPAGAAHPLFADFPPVLEVGHWHNDMPGLTDDAVVLATSAACSRQILAYGPLTFGFQCHMELTPEVVEMLIAASGGGLAAGVGQRFVEQPEALRAHDWDTMNQVLYGFLDRLSAAYAAQHDCSISG